MKRLILILCLALVLTTLVACGNNAGNTPGSETTQPNAQTDGSDVSQKTTFTAGFSADITTIDPYDALNAATIAFREMIFDSLMFRTNDGIDYQLCTDYSHNGDGTEWTVTIRDDVTFQNGEPMTSADCIATFQYIKDNVGVLMVPTYTYGAKLDSFHAVDDYTFVINFTVPIPEATLINYFAYTPILCASSIPEGDATWSADNMVGSGPWIYDEWVNGQYVHAVKNDAYWNKEYVTTVEDMYIRYISEEATRVSALQNGELDYVPNVSNDQVGLLVDDPDLTITTKNSLTMCYADLSYKEGSPCRDKNFRQALTHCINRQGICDNILGGGTALATPVSPSNALYYLDLPVPEYDLDAARDYLAQSTYGGEPVKLLIDGQLLKAQEIILQIVSDMEEIGLNVDFEVLAPAEMTEVRKAGNYTIAIVYRGMGMDPGDLYTSDIVDNTHGMDYDNEEMKELASLAGTTISSEDRTAILNEIQQKVYDEVAPQLYLFEYEANYIVRSDFAGIIYSLDGGYCLKFVINS